jgi:xylulokinase
VEIVAAEEGAAYGAAVLAGVGAGCWASVDEACDSIVRVATCVQPQREASSLMQRNYQVYRQIYPALRRALENHSAS